MSLSYYDIKRILNPKKTGSPEDDFRMLDSWAEYDETNNVPINDRPLNFLCYEIESINPDTGEKLHFFKAIKLARVIRLPKAAKQSTSFMDMQTQILSGVYEGQYNLITVIANIIDPVPLGLLFLYGVQGVGENIDEAKEQAQHDYTGFISMMQGTFRVLELRTVILQESEWLREKMYSMDYLTVVRGIPKANKSGEDMGNKGFGGKNLNPESHGTLEEMIVGLVDYEYIIQVLSTPVFPETLREWSAKTQRDMTDWNSQLQGTKAMSFNLSVPMMFMANSSTSEGWNKAYTDADSVSYSQGESFSQGHTDSTGQSFSESFSQSFGHTTGTSVSDSSSSSTSHSDGVSDGSSTGQSLGSSLSHSNGTSDSVSSGTSDSTSSGSSTSHSDGTSNGVTQGTSEGNSYSVSNGTSESQSNTTGTNNSTSISDGENLSSSAGTSTGSSTGTSESTSHGTSSGYGTSSSNGTSTGASASVTSGTSESSGTSGGGGASLFGLISANASGSSSEGYSDGYSLTGSDGTSQTSGTSTSASSSTGTTDGSSLGTSAGTSNTDSSGTSHSVSSSSGTSESYGVSQGQTFGTSYGVNSGSSSSSSVSSNSSDGWGTSSGVSSGTSAGTSSGTSAGESTGISSSSSSSASSSVSATDGYSVSNGHTTGTSASDSVTNGTSTSQGTSTGQSDSTSQGTSTSSGTGSSTSSSNGVSGAVSSGMSTSMGLGPSIGYNKSYQWLDQQVQDILELLEFQNERIKKALRGAGAFYTYVYIACATEDALSAAQASAKSTWQNADAMISPVQVLSLPENEQQHLLYHLTAFSTDVTREDVYGVQQYKYATVLLSDEYVSYTHLPRVSEGGVFAEVNDIPKFSVPSMLKGDIYMGTILSPERYSMKNGYRTPYDYRIDDSELMHGFFTGASRSGKTVAAMRFTAELSKVVRKNTGKRLRIVCLDPKSDWRTLARFVEPERFRFYSLGNTAFRPIKLNPWKIPRGVVPQQWIDGIIDIYCRAYGLLERGKQMIAEVVYDLYREAGVFDATEKEDWKDTVSELSRQVTFTEINERMIRKKVDLEDPTRSKGRAGNDQRDAYARLIDRLQAFSREFSVERRLFGTSDGLAVDELIGADDVTVLESNGLENTFKNFVFGVITSGFYKVAKSKEKGFLAEDEYETVLVIEEANEVLTGNDTAGTGGGSTFGMTGQSEFEQILDQSAGYGLFIMAITQKIADMPKSVLANCGLVFAGRLKTEEDTSVVIRAICREERFEDRDLVKWFPRSPTGWFVCQSSRTFNFKDAEPILVQIARLNIAPPTNAEIEEILSTKKLLDMHKCGT